MNVFKNKVFTKHLNHLNQITISYEIIPFNVILPKKGNNLLRKIIYLIVIGFIVIVILIFYKKRKYRKKNVDKIYNMNKGDEELQFFEF